MGSFEFELFLAFFSLVCRFLCYLWLCDFSFFYVIFLNFSLAFGLLAMLHVSWIQNSNFVLFVVNVLTKGDIEKPSGQYIGLIVMSN
jgi:hypothetical protein